MNRTFVGLLFAAAVFFGGSTAHAQVVIQGQGQAGGVYGQGTVYVQPGTQPVAVQPSPYTAVAQPAQPQPVRTIVHTSPTMALLVPGIIAFGAGWLIHGLGALSIQNDCSDYLGTCPSDDWVGFSWIPLVGPWLAAGVSEYTGGYEWFNYLFGVIQGVGAVLTVLGLVIQQEWEEAIYAGIDLGEGRSLAFDVGGAGNGAQVDATLTF